MAATLMRLDGSLARACMPGPQGAAWSSAYDPGITDTWWQTLTAGVRRPRVVLHGGYGKHNLGDDAILDVLLGQVKAHVPDARVTVLAHGPEFVRRRYGVRAHHFTTPGALRAVLASDLYVIGGGGIVNRINSYSGMQRLRLLDPKGKFLFVAAALARAFGAKVMLHSVGITSFPDALVRRLTLSTVKWAHAISVRDLFSARLLKQAGVTRPIPVVYDPAVRLIPASPERARQILSAEGADLTKPSVVVNFRPVADPAVDNEHTAYVAACLVRRLIECYNLQVIFFPFGRHPHKAVENDLAFLARMRVHLGQVDNLLVIRNEYTPAEAKAMLGQARVCVVERLHAAILAVSIGVPIVNVSYDDKATAFMEMVALHDAVVPLAEFSVEAVEQRLHRWLT